MKLHLLTPVIVLATAILPAAASAAPLAVRLVAGPVGGRLDSRAVKARLGDPVRVCAMIQLGSGRRARFFADPDVVYINGRRLRGRRLLPTRALAREAGSQTARNLVWRWYRVEPRPHHVDTPPPNEGNPAYSNATLFGASHGKWLGYDQIEYHETLIVGQSGSCITVDRTHPTHPKVDVNGGLGTMRYKASVTLDGGVPCLSCTRGTHSGGGPPPRVLSSPGMESRGRTGISAAVLRVTFRSADTLTGHLRGFFNVPNVFGSGGYGRRHQTELYQGADCADVIIGAAREGGARLAYTSVLGFRRHARPTTGKLLMTREGMFHADGPERGRAVKLRFGEEVHPGDIMLIDYAGFDGSPRSWDHIAVVDRDRGVRGQLDPQDPVLHMGYLFGLTEEPAATQAPAVIQLLRFRPSILRAIGRRRSMHRGQAVR